MVDVFEATFQDKKMLNGDLIRKWFDMALSEFCVEIEPLTFDEDENVFIYHNKQKEDGLLPRLYVNILGYTIKKFYCEREYDRFIKRTNIITKDVTLNNTDADKKNAREELDYINSKLESFYFKLKPTAYN